MKKGLFQTNRSSRHGTKPAGRGAPPQTTDPAGDFGAPNIPTNIRRYGPDTSITNTPSNRVATGRIPPTGGGMTRYTASTDGAPIHVPAIDRASKWVHGNGQQDWSHRNIAVAKTGHSQNPKQVKLNRTGKKTGN